MKKVSLSFKLILGFMGVAVITAIVAIVGWVSTSQLTQRIDKLGNESIPAIVDLEMVKVNHLQIRVVLRTFMTPYVTKEEYIKQMENVQAARSNYKDAMKRYEDLHKTPKETELFNKFKELLEISIKANNEYFELAKGYEDPAVDKVALSQKLYEMNMNGEVRDAFLNQFSAQGELLEYVKDFYGKKAVKESTDTAAILNALIIGLAAIGIVLSIALGIIIARSITKPVTRINEDLFASAGSLESAAGQVSTSSQELSSGAAELASSVEEMTSSLEELQSIIESNTKNIGEGELMMRETMTGSKLAVSKMTDLKVSHEEIKDNSQKIVRIIKVIDDIAFQTNILALNAAVEAARAGDAGRGFAVVADQVKNLASKSAEAAKETSLLIESAIDSVNKGYSLGNEVGDTLNKAVDLATKVSQILEEVNRASNEQLKGATQVTKAVGQINTVVQQTASSSEETAAAGEELLSQAEMMKGIVENLNVLVKGTNGSENNGNGNGRQRISSGNGNHNGNGHKAEIAHLESIKSDARKSREHAMQLSHKDGDVEIIKAEDRIPMNDFKDF